MTIIKVIGYCSCCCLPLRKNLPPAVGTFRSTSASELRSHSSQASHSPKWNTAERWPVLSKARFLRGSLVSQALSINKQRLYQTCIMGWGSPLSPPSPLYRCQIGITVSRLSLWICFLPFVSFVPISPYSYGKLQARQPSLFRKWITREKRGRRICGLENKKDTATNCNMDHI